MSKDPAFLFYSKDFYEGTRLMLPEERACFIDLLIYQHQNGPIPLDTKRMLMYCSGVNEATLQATLQAKFKQTDKGWVNLKMVEVTDDRSSYKGKQSDNGVLGQFFKKAKSSCKAAEYKALRSYVYEDYGKENLISELKKEQTTHEGLLQALLKHLASVNEDVNEDKDDTKQIIVPEFSDFESYANEKAAELGMKLDPKDVRAKYESWKVNGWKTGNDRPIKNWKSTLLNTIKYLQSDGNDTKLTPIEQATHNINTGANAWLNDVDFSGLR